MTDVLVYWRDYKQNGIRQHAGDRARYWHSNSNAKGLAQGGLPPQDQVAKSHLSPW
jgi:hypothetical protein